MNLPPLHIVATDEVAARPGFERLAGDLLRAGGTGLAVHLRVRSAVGRSLFRLARTLSEIARESGGWCVVNGRVDVALTAGAQAVQLGQDALPVGPTRQVLEDRAVIGASVHSVEEGLRRLEEGADYLIAGTVFPSATHPGVPAAGLGLIEACAGLGVPVVGIGGIDRKRAPSVMGAGAAGIAVVRAVWDQAEPLCAASELLEVVSAGTDKARRGSTRTSSGNREC